MPYKETSAEEHSVFNDHRSLLLSKVSVNVNDRQDKRPTIYWLLKLHKERIKHNLSPTLLLNFLKY